MSRLAIITFITPGGVDIDNGLPVTPSLPGNALPGWSGPVDPGYGRPIGGGRPDNSLPSAPVRPDNGLPIGPPGSIGTLPVFPYKTRRSQWIPERLITRCRPLEFVPA